MLPSRVKLGLGVDVSLGKMKLKQWTVNYHGAQYVKIRDWRAEGDFDISMKYFVSPRQPVNQMTLGWTFVIGMHGFYHSGISNGKKIFSNFRASNGTHVSISSSKFTAPQIVRDVRFKRENGVCSFFIDDELIGSIENHSTFGLDVIGAGTQRITGGLIDGSNTMMNWNGHLWDVALTDLSKSDNSRNYSSIIKSNSRPYSTVLIDALNKLRKNDWLLRFHQQALKIPKWVSSADGDTVTFKFTLNSLPKHECYLIDNSAKTRSYVVLNHNGDNRITIYPESSFVEFKINGSEYKNNEFTAKSNVTYECHIKYKRGIEILSLCNRCELNYGIDGIMYDLKMNSATDTRHYPCHLVSDTQPETDIIIDTIGGKNGVMESRGGTTHQWTNELSSDGELVGFGDELWTEL